MAALLASARSTTGASEHGPDWIRDELYRHKVWVYAHDRTDEAKRDRAATVLDHLSPSELIISTQV